MMYDRRTAKIIDGRAYTDGDTELYTDLAPEEQRVVLDWIRRNLKPRKTALMTRSSYGLKHLLEHDTKIYMTNNQFKDAMLACGFYPVDERQLNWNYCISKRSPAFTHVGGTYGEGGAV